MFETCYTRFCRQTTFRFISTKYTYQLENKPTGLNR